MEVQVKIRGDPSQIVNIVSGSGQIFRKNRLIMTARVGYITFLYIVPAV